MSFNTLEDVNGTIFDNQGFWWHCIDLSKINDGTELFTDAKLDFCTVSRTDATTYKIRVNNDLWTRGWQLDINGSPKSGSNIIRVSALNPPLITIMSDAKDIKLYLYLGHEKYTGFPSIDGRCKYDVLNLNLKELKNTHKVKVISVYGIEQDSNNLILHNGFNKVTFGNNYDAGYVYVNLIRTNFQFQCDQLLTVGEVNTVQLGTLADYKVGGDLVGDYETKLSVLYNGKTIPVVWNETLNDYTFDLDLTDKTTEGKIRFKVIVETNDVLNHTETDVVLDANYETINTLAKLTELFSIGGVGRLGANLTLTNDLTLAKSVNLIGNDCSIDMASHKISVGSDLTFKAQTVNFSNGVNTVQQEPNSTVEITDCSFTDCTGFGSVIDCQVDLASLDETDDFHTKLNNCTISDCDMAILHGGNLEVNRCNVNGKISNKNYPFFLYQTDGNAVILNSEFNLTDNTVYDYDIEFNSCIFTCGETAIINGYSHTELQNNNLTAFFDTQRNTSTIDIQYYYSLIEANVHLQSNKGYCHSVSNVDYVYKTNIQLTRGE